MSKTILIVEDEPFIVDALTFLLEREGHDCKGSDQGPLSGRRRRSEFIYVKTLRQRRYHQQC
jgi:DNA-binding response OmpR family regulator